MENYLIDARLWDGHFAFPKGSVLLLAGGEDVHPQWYGEKPHVGCYYNIQRDKIEIAAYNAAIRQGIPILGICRGHQLAAVMNGSRLIHDIDPPHSFHHGIITYPTMIPKPLRSIFPTKVNSLHHQGVALRQRPRNALVLAIHQGVVETLWYPQLRMLTVQWHPELMHDGFLEAVVSFLKGSENEKGRNVVWD